MPVDKKYIIFTDLKDFTYKNALLTDEQIKKILKEFDSLVQAGAKKYSVQIIKSIGDAYLSVCDSPSNAYKFANFILEESKKHDEKEHIDLKKISLRATITYGSVTQNRVLDLDDYFWEAINLWARIMDMTPAGQIFCWDAVQKKLQKICKVQYIWDYWFHGILTDVPLYSLTPISQELINTLKKSQDSRLKECDELVFRASCVAAVLSIQPVPFLENLNLVAVHLYMIVRISQKFGNSLSLKQSSQVLTELIAPLWISYAAFQWSASLVKILLPWIGWFLFAPVSFSVSYALGKLYIMYFYYQDSGEVLTPELIKELYKKHKKEWKKLAKDRKEDIVSIGKKYSGEVLSFKKGKEFTKVQQDTIVMLQSKK